MKIIQGNLISLAQSGAFDIIIHGCNCFNNMGSGLAPQMAKAFGCDKFLMEAEQYKGDYNKLGQIDWQKYANINCPTFLNVINAYTQYWPGKPSPGCSIPLDYDALRLCLRKVNYTFKGQHIGLPWIGCGLAKGNQDIVAQIISEELTDMQVTIVEYKP